MSELEVKQIEEKVKEAYDKLGLKPVNKTFVKIEDDEICGCAMTALYCASKGIELKDVNHRIKSLIGSYGFTERLAKELGLETEYVAYFIYGFDDRDYSKDDMVQQLSLQTPHSEGYEYYQSRIYAYDDGERTRRFLGL